MLKIIKNNSEYYRFSHQIDGAEAGRAFLYLINNDLHPEPYGLLEDVFVEEKFRKQGVGTELVKAVIEKAKELSCYKLICTSREGKESVHQWYEGMGFEKCGFEFRMDFEKE